MTSSAVCALMTLAFPLDAALLTATANVAGSGGAGVPDESSALAVALSVVSEALRNSPRQLPPEQVVGILIRLRQPQMARSSQMRACLPVPVQLTACQPALQRRGAGSE